MEWIPAPVLTAWFFAVGLCIGSFLNVCIARIPEERSVVFPPSACPRCSARIRWYDNIPLLSYLLLLGRCRSCRGRISPVYPIVELVEGITLAGLFARNGISVELVRGLIFISCLVVLFFIDLRHMILPNVITFPCAVLGLLFSVLGAAPLRFVDALAGSCSGAAALLVVMGLYYLLRRRQGMGTGDVKMMLSVGAFVGLKGALFTLVAASLAGGLFSIGLLLAGRKFDSEVPFGCFLAPAAALAYVTASAPVDWYLSLLLG
ncbi:MAG: prepilin peptidase [Acidobacteriota bacterium]